MDAKTKDKILLVLTGFIFAALALGYSRLTGKWAFPIVATLLLAGSLQEYVSLNKRLAQAITANPLQATQLPKIKIEPFAKKYILASVFLILFAVLALVEVVREGTMDYGLVPMILLQLITLKMQNTKEKLAFLQSGLRQAEPPISAAQSSPN